MGKTDLEEKIEELTADKDLYINLKALTERFVDIDGYYNHEPWSLQQILVNINMIQPIKINPDRAKAHTEYDDMFGGTDVDPETDAWVDEILHYKKDGR